MLPRLLDLDLLHFVKTKNNFYQFIMSMMLPSTPTKSSRAILQWILLSFFLHFVWASSELRIISQPLDQRVPLNSTVRLSCRVSVRPGLHVNWLKNGFGMGDNPAKIRRFSPRYSLPDNVNEGQFDLQIRNVRLGDDGKFRCQATILPGGQPVLSRLATLYVLVPSMRPVLHQKRPPVRQSVVDKKRRAWVEDGKKLVLQCVAQYGRPGAILGWKIDGRAVVPRTGGRFVHDTLIGQIKSSNKKDRKHKGLVTSVSTLNTTMSKLHHDKTITCFAINEGYEHMRQQQTTTKLEVRYRPHVLIKVEPLRVDNVYDENEMIHIKCMADGRPDQYHWQWKVIRNGKVKDVEKIAESYYKLRVKREMDRMTFRCIAMNYAAGKDEVTIRVTYAPNFKKPSAELYPAKIGGQVRMRCDVDSNPPPLIEWLRRGSTEVLARGPEMVRKAIQLSDLGAYVCRASAGSYSPIEKVAYLEIRGPPSIRSNTPSYGIKSRTGNVLCYITAIPAPKQQNVHWFRHGRRLDNSGRYSMKLEPFLRGVKAYLSITRLSASDFGAYNCTVGNGEGWTSQIVTLLPQETISVAFITGAAISVTLTSVVIIIILCLCRKNNVRRRMYKQAQRQMKNSALTDSLRPKSLDEEELVFRPPVTAAISTTSHAPVPEHAWRAKVLTSAPPPGPGGIALTAGGPGGLGLGRYEFDERSSLRNGTFLRYKGIDLSPPPSALHATEEEEAYKEDSARSFDSGYSPGPTLTHFTAPQAPPSTHTHLGPTFAQHGFLAPSSAHVLTYMPMCAATLGSGLRSQQVKPYSGSSGGGGGDGGGGAVVSHSTNV